MCQTCHQMSPSLYPILHIPYHPVHALLPLGFTKWLRVFTDGRVKYPISRALLAVTDSALEEPTCYSNAIKLLEWRQAMQAEFNALLQNQTWTLVPPQTATNLVGCKWVFKVKRKADGSIERHKARVVAKGFHQQAGLDYGETFNPVVKPTTIQTMLSIAREMHQIDIQNAFLHGFLDEEVYMLATRFFSSLSTESCMQATQGLIRLEASTKGLVFPS